MWRRRRSLSNVSGTRFLRCNLVRWVVVIFIGLYILSGSVCLAQETQGDNHAQKNGGDSAKGMEMKPKSNTLPNSTFWGAFWNSVVMILATEIGDKTFFLAALMAMQNPRVIVFLGAISSLAVMTVLSAAMGLMLPSFLPRSWMQFAGSLLFFCFGIKLIKEGLNAGTGPSEELYEAEQEFLIANKKMKTEDHSYESPLDLETGMDDYKSTSSRSHQQKGNIFSPLFANEKFVIFSTAFSMTLLAEWGDRSQIATIALAASQSACGVTVGAIVGHMICTMIAVLGGRILASRISERNVHLVGGVLFLLFAVQFVISGLYSH